MVKTENNGSKKILVAIVFAQYYKHDERIFWMFKNACRFIKDTASSIPLFSFLLLTHTQNRKAKQPTKWKY